MSFLKDLLATLADVPPEDQPAIIQQAITDAQGLNPADLSAEVLEHFDSLTEGDNPADDATLVMMETLARVADGIGIVNQQNEERAARQAEIGDRLRALTTPQDEPAAEPEPAAAPAEDTPHADEELPVDPAPEDDAAPAGRELVTANVNTPKPVTPAAPPARAAARAAARAGGAPVRTPLGNRNSALPDQRTNANGLTPFAKYSLVAAADVPEFSTGQKMDGLADLSRAWEHRMGPMITGNVNSGRDGERTRVGLARIKRDVPDEFLIRDDSEAAEKIEHATNESRLPGGSLVAAAGWCAPSEQLYDLCPIRMTPTGMIDLPSVTARRGGIRYPADFDWSAIWGSTGFYLTEAEAIAGVPKSCVEVPCPTDFEEARMDVSGMCIRTPILMERGWPERVEQFMQGSLLVHAHKMNARKLAKMEAMSTKITFAAPPAPSVNAIADPHGPGAVESLLSIIELQVQYQRYRDRLSQSDTLELVAPYWMRGVLKSDLRKKLGIDNRWNVTDAMVDGYLRAVGVSPQYVYDWQDSLASGSATDFGGDIPTEWPEKVKFLLYPAGTFFQLQADVINLDGVYDHASLVQNVYTALFTEEGWQVASRCGTSYVVEVNLCANGLSGSQQLTTC